MEVGMNDCILNLGRRLSLGMILIVFLVVDLGSATGTSLAMAGELVGEAPRSIVALVTVLEENYFLKTILPNGEIVFEDKTAPRRKPTIHIRLDQGQTHGDIYLSENKGEVMNWKHLLDAEDNSIESYQAFIDILQVVADSPDDVKAFDPSLAHS
ncbi:MAG: hypothetical protein ACI9CF_001548 [Candidatus Omnitrophota bacterium]|jgi:hypothetical protein